MRHELDSVGKRLNFLLSLKGVQKKELADILDLSQGTISNYIADKRSPDLDTLKKISRFLNVRSDFLLGLTDNYSTYVQADYKGNHIEIDFKDYKLRLTDKQVEELLYKLDESGWNVERLLKDK